MDTSISDVAYTALISKLLANTALKAVVSTRITPPKPLNQTEPYVTVIVLPHRTRHGLTYNEPDSVLFRAQIEGWASSYTACVDLMSLIEKAIDGEFITVTGWGSCRMECSGAGITDYIQNDVTHYQGARRVTYLLANQSTS